MQSVICSVIIPLKKCNDFLDENISALLKGTFKNFEIIVLPDNKEKKSFPKTRIVPTGNVRPAEKRDIGARKAKGKILAFIDDDAYPSKDWLKKAITLFNTMHVAAVCGPGVTPPSDSIFQRVSGVFSSTFIGGGPYTYRFIPQREREVDDYPSMNFLIRKSDFLRIGGFDTKFWPGEDTKLCFDLTQKYRKKIFYHPDVLVYHHRRAIFKPHLLQNGRYGLQRGYFAKTLPKTSLRISYFFPSFLLFGILLLPFIYIVNRTLFSIDLFLFSFYMFFVVLTAAMILIREKNTGIAFLLIPTIFVTHLYYGIKFIEGFLFTTRMKS